MSFKNLEDLSRKVNFVVSALVVAYREHRNERSKGFSSAEKIKEFNECTEENIGLCADYFDVIMKHRKDTICQAILYTASMCRSHDEEGIAIEVSHTLDSDMFFDLCFKKSELCLSNTILYLNEMALFYLRNGNNLFFGLKDRLLEVSKAAAFVVDKPVPDFSKIQSMTKEVIIDLSLITAQENMCGERFDQIFVVDGEILGNTKFYTGLSSAAQFSEKMSGLIFQLNIFAQACDVWNLARASYLVACNSLKDFESVFNAKCSDDPRKLSNGESAAISWLDSARMLLVLDQLAELESQA